MIEFSSERAYPEGLTAGYGTCRRSRIIAQSGVDDYLIGIFCLVKTKMPCFMGLNANLNL